MTGILPHEIGNLQSLVYFGAENNRIEGSFPFDVLINISSLQTLILWRNKFTGSLSRDAANLTMLTSLELMENFFVGKTKNNSKIAHVRCSYPFIQKT